MSQSIIKKLIVLTISAMSINSFAAISYDRTKVSVELMQANNEIERLSNANAPEQCKSYLNTSKLEVLEAFKVVSVQGSKDAAISHTNAAYKAIENVESDWWSCKKLSKQTVMAKTYLNNARNYLND